MKAELLDAFCLSFGEGDGGTARRFYRTKEDATQAGQRITPWYWMVDEVRVVFDGKCWHVLNTISRIDPEDAEGLGEKEGAS